MAGILEWEAVTTHLPIILHLIYLNWLLAKSLALKSVLLSEKPHNSVLYVTADRV